MPLTDKSTTQPYTPSAEELNRSVSFSESPNPQEEENIRAARLDLYNNRMEFNDGWLSALAKEEIEALNPKTEVLAQAATSNQVEKTTEYSLVSQEPETTYTELAAKSEQNPLNEQWANHLALYGSKIMDYRAKAKK